MTNGYPPVYEIDESNPNSTPAVTSQIIFSYPTNDPVFLMSSMGNVIFTESGMTRYRSMVFAYSIKFQLLIKELNDIRCRLRKMICLSTPLNTYLTRKLKECEESLKDNQLAGLDLLPQLYRNCLDSTQNYIERYGNQQDVVPAKGIQYHEVMANLTEIEKCLVNNLEECSNLRNDFEMLIEVWKYLRGGQLYYSYITNQNAVYPQLKPKVCIPQGNQEEVDVNGGSTMQFSVPTGFQHQLQSQLPPECPPAQPDGLSSNNNIQSSEEPQFSFSSNPEINFSCQIDSSLSTTDNQQLSNPLFYSAYNHQDHSVLSQSIPTTITSPALLPSVATTAITPSTPTFMSNTTSTSDSHGNPVETIRSQIIYSFPSHQSEAKKSVKSQQNERKMYNTRSHLQGGKRSLFNVEENHSLCQPNESRQNTDRDGNQSNNSLDEDSTSSKKSSSNSTLPSATTLEIDDRDNTSNDDDHVSCAGNAVFPVKALSESTLSSGTKQFASTQSASNTLSTPSSSNISNSSSGAIVIIDESRRKRRKFNKKYSFPSSDANFLLNPLDGYRAVVYKEMSYPPAPDMSSFTFIPPFSLDMERTKSYTLDQWKSDLTSTQIAFSVKEKHGNQLVEISSTISFYSRWS